MWSGHLKFLLEIWEVSSLCGKKVPSLLSLLSKGKDLLVSVWFMEKYNGVYH